MKRLLLVLTCLAAAALLLWHPAPTPPPALAVISTAGPRHRPSATPPGDPVVYVAGAVARPGLYRVQRDARADDAVRAAGGLRTDADASRVNLAAHIKDGDEIYAPVLGEPSSRIVHRRSPTRTARTKKNVAVSADVNTASAQTLALVPGIGATLAARIVEVRERDGAYTSFDELLDVAGMTPARLTRAEPYLRI